MGESSHNHNPNPSRLGPRNSAVVGEIVEVQGGHIVRSIGRKDRHSKVCTAKGPRDRRVRLAAHTAIQFYDVQDRLGYDRPSKAVDWLIKKAKSAIDELEQLPAWHPTAQNVTVGIEQAQKKLEQDEQQQLGFSSSSSKQAMSMLGDGNEQHSSSFLPPSLDSDAIADTIKSFFPMGASAEASSSAMQFQSFSNSHSQDLRLSLQSFQDPIMLHHHQNPSHHHPEQPHSQSQQVLLSAIPLGFDSATTWPDHQAELSRFQRPPVWNPGGDPGGGGSGGAGAGYVFNSPQQLQQLLGGHSHNQYFTQRGPLQSSNTPSVRAWIDPSSGDNNNPPFMPIYPSSISGIGFSSGFHIPARIQGDEEEHDGCSDKPSSASSDSRH